MNYITIAAKLEELIKKKITEDGLVKSGKMRDSIKVSAGPDGFKVSAVDYFLYLNKEYNIMGEVIASSEFKQFMQKELSKQIEREITK